MRHKTHTTAIVAMMLAVAALVALPPGAEGEAAGPPAAVYAADIDGWMDGGAATTETMQDARLRDTRIAAALDGIDGLGMADAWVDRHEAEAMKQFAERHGLEHRTRATAGTSRHAATRGGASKPNRGDSTRDVRWHGPSVKGAGDNWQPERRTEGAQVQRTCTHNAAKELAQSRPRPRERVNAHRVGRQAMTDDTSNRYGPEGGPAGEGQQRERRLTC